MSQKTISAEGSSLKAVLYTIDEWASKADKVWRQRRLWKPLGPVQVLVTERGNGIAYNTHPFNAGVFNQRTYEAYQTFAMVDEVSKEKVSDPPKNDENSS